MAITGPIIIIWAFWGCLDYMGFIKPVQEPEQLPLIVEFLR